jgi:hypothetical protein
MPDQSFVVFWKARGNRGRPEIAGKPGREHVCIVYSTAQVTRSNKGKKGKKKKQ